METMEREMPVLYYIGYDVIYTASFTQHNLLVVHPIARHRTPVNPFDARYFIHSAFTWMKQKR